ncbi:MAG: CoA transferase [Gammaproteobacteria bacterium]|nr:CoA transferase [Gammaproteobacteria bacterium]
MLTELRVLDLSTEMGLMCGQLLADMGADVQQWVLPEDESSLDDYHGQAYTLGKGVRCLDWRSAPETVREQVRFADVLIESERPGEMASVQLSYATLAQINPKLIQVSITGFGGTGPKSGYHYSDLTAAAASGHIYVTGSAGEPPLRITCPQAHGHACSDAAVAVLIAVFERSQSGCGQHIDISAQQSTTLALLNRALDAPVGQEKAIRSASGATVNGVYLRSQFEARDGWVVCLAGVLPPLAQFMQRLMEWVVAEGLCDEEYLSWDWGSVAAQILQGKVSADQWARVTGGIEALIGQRTKAELMAEAVARRLLIAPVFTVADLLDSVHIQQRDYLVPGRSGRRIGAFAKLSASPLPLTENIPGQWRDESRFEPITRHGSELRTDPVDMRGGPLAGLKVLDVFWVIAGPGATRMLADYGATVIHIESTRRQDMVRNVPPYIDGTPDPERAACHHSTNANKLNVTLDLSSEQGREVLRDLIRWADVFTESFAPGAIARMGFDYQTVKALNPDIIMISSSLMGQTGEWSGYAGFGNSAAAVTGFHALTGRPRQPPTGVFGPYTDFTSVRFNALALLGAVLHLRRTGVGQYIDMSQGEAALHFLAPECLRYLRDGVVRTADGNRDERYAPQGVYRVAGLDRWLAVCIRGQAQWVAFCELAGFENLATMNLAARRAAHDELDDQIQRWMADQDGVELELQLQSAGVAAHRVLDTHELGQDPQLAHRGHYLPVAHPQFSNAVVESTRLRFSRTKAIVPTIAPSFGVHNEKVLREVLGYDASRYQELHAGGVLS